MRTGGTPCILFRVLYNQDTHTPPPSTTHQMHFLTKLKEYGRTYRTSHRVWRILY